MAWWLGSSLWSKLGVTASGLLLLHAVFCAVQRARPPRRPAHPPHLSRVALPAPNVLAPVQIAST